MPVYNNTVPDIMNKSSHAAPYIDSFNFRAGRVLGRKYEVTALLGGGWEGEVYKVIELATGIERAVKLFYPERNLKDKSIRFYAKKLHKLRHCNILIQYHHQEVMIFRGIPVSFLVSDYVEGEMLSSFIARHPGKRLSVFEGLHLLHTLASGMECIHRSREYHGDLHDNNVMIQHRGIGFDLKVLDLFHMGACKPVNIHHDVLDMVRIFYDAIGGQRFYAKHPQQVKDICNGLKRSLILKKFRSAGQLREYLENLDWE